ncbi:MAG TPA: hypothetical protein PKM63_06205 [Panacibacter sp.]|nr:hypothetical protein [Panacibacter sp.]HNP43859.1 hypothetical protein [Panacibacter sp.]
MKLFLHYLYRRAIGLLGCCILCFHSFSQQSFSDEVVKNFEEYQASHFNEKIFVHTDKSFYLAGESMWFKLYCVDEFYFAPSVLSKIGYVELINNEGKAALRSKIDLSEGLGSGSFILPTYLQSGNYTLVAYTSWMRNFDPQFYYHQQVTIVNTLKPAFVKEQPTVNSSYVQFFPEGGNLVEGIMSKVAFKVVDRFGEPVDCKGSVMDKENKVVASFQSLRSGMGNFMFKPLKGDLYTAVVKLADTTITCKLPTAYTHGVVMQLENINEAQLQLTVTSNMEAGNEVVFMLAQSRNLVKDFQQKNFSNGTCIFMVDKSKLADGVSQLTIFNASRQPICERLFFKNPQLKLNIVTKIGQDNYQARKPVTISLELPNVANMPQRANMSMSVFMLDSLQGADYNDIQNYLYLSSELRGNINQPGFYFSNDKEAVDAADNLMLTQGWRRFKWENVLQNKKPFFQFLPEREGMIVNGKVIHKRSGIATQNVLAFLTVPGEHFQLSATNSTVDGSVVFNAKRFYSSGTIIVKAADSNCKVELVPAYADSFPLTVSAFQMPEKWKDQLLKRSIDMQADNAYLFEEKQQAYVLNSDTSVFYGKPDKRYYLDDYTRFITMEEVMREYVSSVRVKKDAQQFHYRVHNSLYDVFFDDDPLVLVDGLPVLNTNEVVAFDPLKIKKLEVMARKYYFQNFSTNGIVSYTTYKGDLAGFPLNEGEVVVEFDGLQQQREFYSPGYTDDNKRSSRLPDLRNVLYWEPEIKTGPNGNAQLTFYTSDVTGKFACVVQGITIDGLTGSSIITFTVVK